MKEFWVMIYNDGNSITASKENKEDAIRFMKEIQRDHPASFADAYVAKVKIIESEKTNPAEAGSGEEET